jgi:hypothetical protein
MKKYPWTVPTRAELNDILADDVIESTRIKVTAELIEPMLGTVPKNEKIFTDFVTEKMGNYQGKPLKTMQELDEEIESCPKEIDKTATGFHKDTFGVFIYNYMLLGNIKSNVFMLMCNGATKVLHYKKAADLFCKVYPRKIRFFTEDDTHLINSDGSLERSLRAKTPKGDRICLKKSDIINSGTRFKFEVKLLRNDRGLTTETIVNALKLGKHNGIGEWRGSGGYGKYKLLSLKYA